MKRKGFTLIELVVVIALIAILAVTLAPRLRDQIAKANDAKAIAALGSLRTASEIYFSDNSKVPGGADKDDLSNLESYVDSSVVDLVNEGGGGFTATALPIGGGRTAAQGSDGDVYYSSDNTIGITFGTDNIELSFASQSSLTSASTYDTKGIAWASY